MEYQYSNGKKLFGDRASRITSEEHKTLYSYYYNMFSKFFKKMSSPCFFPEKKTHGDIDIIAVPNSYDWVERVHDVLGDTLLDYHKNGTCYSHLIHNDDTGKAIHLDFLTTFREPVFHTMKQFYSFNDLSAIINMLARNYGFRYGSLGFFKRYQDTKGNTHYILLSFDLDVGLKVLGYDPEKFHMIQGIQEAVKHIESSPLFDNRFFQKEEMTQKNKKDYKRPNIKYIIDELKKSEKKSSLYDIPTKRIEYAFPDLSERIEKKIKCIESAHTLKENYNGKWIMDTFNLKSGSHIGDIKDAIHVHYGLQCNLIEEEEMINYIKGIIHEK